MKRYLTLFLYLVLLLSIGCAATPSSTTIKVPAPGSSTWKPEQKLPEEVGRVARIIDGNTIEVSIGGRIEIVRLIGIDAPEWKRRFFKAGTAKAKELLEGKQVRLLRDLSDRDRDGRLLRYVFEGRTFVNAELVKLGYANVYTCLPDLKYADFFVKLEREARQNNRGLWAQAAPQAERKFVASKSSKRYHYPTCAWAQKIKPAQKVWFFSAEDAQAKGYVPCRVCKPAIAVAGKSVSNPRTRPALP